ncbi:MAG: tetratricopeptide repeat protein [Bacteroidota bacterium]|nr:tetratricopeptide repeat protein [Bacteroidota bacterium]
MFYCRSRWDKISRVVIFFTSVFVLSSCAPSTYEVISTMLDQGKNDDALALARAQLLKAPQDPLYLKYMGIALFNKKYYNESVSYLEQSLKLDPEDDQAVYYLASCYEAVFEYAKAIQYYRRYNELTIFGEYKQLVEARIKVLFRQQMDIEAKQALLEESRLDVAKIPSNTVAVLYFNNLGSQHDLDPLQKGLAEMMITDLSKVKSLRVVERLRLEKLMEELNLANTDLVDERTAPRLGKLLGAYHLIKGSFFDLTSEKVRIDALIAQTRTGAVDATTDIAGNVTDFFRLEKELVFKIIGEMGVKLSDEERESILTVPTENFFAFLQYSQGMDYEDKGMYAQAVQSYQKAVQTDPKFAQAKSNLAAAQQAEQMSGRSSSHSPGGVKQALPPPPSSEAVKENVGAVSDRASSTATNVSAGFTPGPSQQTTPPVVTAPLPEPPKPPR